jgi:mannose-1-phosphate guanylyltransferase
MKALLLAAGFGTRLRPITDSVPKCLVPINDRALLDYWLENLHKAGIEEFLINTHYLHREVEKFVSNSKYKNIVYLKYEPKLLLTGGTILNNRNFFNDEAFMVVHADNLCFCDFKEFIKSHHNRPGKCIATMMIFESNNPKECGVVQLDKDGVVTKFYEKIDNPPSNLANGAVYIFEPEIFNILKRFENKKIDLSTQVIPLLLDKIYTYYNSVYLKDIGTIKNYALSQIEVLKYI